MSRTLQCIIAKLTRGVIRAIFGAADVNAPGMTGPSNTPWIPTHIQGRIQDSPAMLPSISSSDIDSRLGLAELSGDLVAHLLGCESA